MEIEDAGFIAHNATVPTVKQDSNINALSPADKALVFPKSQRSNKHAVDVDEFTGNVPGTQSVWIKTQGCSHNFSDSEYMAGILQNYGFRIVDDSEVADIWLLNSCTVKDPSQAAFINYVAKGKEKGIPVVVAGCVSQADRNLSGLDGVSIVGVTQIDRVVEAVEQTLQGNVVRMLAKKSLPSLDLPKVRRNPLVEIVPLSTGCLGACTYCKTRQARGKLGSYALEAIVSRCEQAVNEGVAEIWLTSEDTGAYGRDIGTNIGELLHSLTKILPSVTPSSDHNLRGVMLRLGMTNPPFMLEHLPVIAEVLRHPNVYSFLHVPVQAGSDHVLTAMNREYTVAEFRKVADYLLSVVPGMTLATDIIAGFPGETEEDFQETVDLITHYKLPVVNISQFYPRPGTPAAKMRRISTKIVKERSRRLTHIFEQFRPHDHLVGKVVKVWFDIETTFGTYPITGVPKDPVLKDEAGNQQKEKVFPQSVGHTKEYVKVVVDTPDSKTADKAHICNSYLPGSCWVVEIVAARRFHVEGLLVNMVYPGRTPEFLRSKAAEAAGESNLMLDSSKLKALSKIRRSNGNGLTTNKDERTKSRKRQPIRYLSPMELSIQLLKSVKHFFPESSQQSSSDYSQPSHTEQSLSPSATLMRAGITNLAVSIVLIASRYITAKYFTK